MSYEGYNQLLCAEGHYWEADCYADYYDELHCPDCGNPPVWQNGVDTTNELGDGEENYPTRIRLELLSEEVTRTCPCCSNVSVVSPRRYKRPENKGSKYAAPCFARLEEAEDTKP